MKYAVILFGTATVIFGYGFCFAHGKLSADLFLAAFLSAIFTVVCVACEELSK